MSSSDNLLSQLKGDLSMFMDKISDHIIILDKECRVLYVNPIVEKYFKKKRKKMIGRNLWKEVPFLVGSRFYNECFWVLENQKSRRFEFYSNVFNEWFSAGIFPFKEGLTAYLVNIDKQKKAEKEKKKAIVFLKSVIEQMPVGVVVAKAPEGNLIMTNHELENIFKFPLKNSSRIEEYNHWEAYHTDTGKRYKTKEWPLTRSLLKGEIVNWEEIKIIKGDDSTGYIRIRSAPIKDKKGNIIAGVAIDNDVTKSKIIADELHQRQQEFKTLVENSPDLIARFDKNLRYSYANPATEKILGLSLEEIINKNNFQVGFSSMTADCWYKHLKNVLKTGQIESLEFEFNTSLGERFYQTWLVPEYDSKNKINSVLSVSRDITNIKELERKKDEFINMASHELKTPVTTIKVFSQILKKSCTGLNYKDISTYSRKIEDQVNKLNKLVDQLLDVSRIQIGKFELIKKNFSLKKLIKETIETIRSIDSSHSIIADNIENVIVYGDKDRICEVLINLLTNAIKYSPSQSIINVQSQKNDREVIVGVTDFGVGIEKKYHQKIFQLLYRVYDNNDRTYPGFGIGLYMASEIIKLHHGTMSVVSEKGKGSTFYFTLPLINKRPKTT